MKTNLKLGGNAVVLDEHGGIVCVIQCKEGKNDITKQLEAAIRNHEDVKIAMVDTPEILYNLDEVSFSADLIARDNVEYSRNYIIELTETY